MAKGKLENMIGGLIEEFMIRESAKAVLDNAEAKIELTVKCNGDTAKGNISYEGNGGGYLYAAYIMLAEVMKNTGIDEIDHFLKIVKGIDELMENLMMKRQRTRIRPGQKRLLTKRWQSNDVQSTALGSNGMAGS